MAIVAGIDEAGFGPLLGPLVVSGVIFKVPDGQADGCLWSALRDSCARRLTKKGRRLVVADSKQVYRSREDLYLLERAVLVMLGLLGKTPRTWRNLLGLVAPAAAETLNTYPWYSLTDLEIPVDDSVGDVATRVNALRRDFARNGVEIIDVFCEPLPEGHFNRLLHKTDNKAVVNMGLVLRIADRILRSRRGETVRICVDHLGGRIRYRDALQTAFPALALQILEETPERSAYRLTGDGTHGRVEFAVGGDSRYFAVALASMFSKYIRELYMRAFNGYWCGQDAALKPTAGYYGDAERWLRDAEPVIKRLAVDPGMLVRLR